MLHFELFLAFSAIFCVVSALTLKSNLYFGTRSRKPRTIQTSLLWTEADSVDRLRYECRHEDDFDTFGWLEHNGYNYGKQQLRDTNNGINMYTEFVETSPNNWGLRVTGLPLNPDYVYDARNISVFFAVTVQGEKNEFTYSRITKKMEKNGISGNTAFYGSSIDIGDFAVYIPDNKNNTYPIRAQTEKTPLESYPGIYKKRKIDSSKELENTQFYGTYVKEEDQWKMKQILSEVLYKSKKGIDAIHENVQATLGPIENNIKLKNKLEKAFKLPKIAILPNTIAENSNTLILQKVVRLPFQIDIVFSTDPESYSSYQLQPKVLPKSIEELSGEKLTSLLSQKSEEFHQKFDEVFKLREKKQFTLPEIQMAQFALSNLIGSVTYFYGDTIQAVIEPGETKASHLIKTRPSELLTVVPSRSFFPRGFFWDEGFQQILVLYWNSTLSLDVISSWMNRQEENGWIEREQILGDESRSKVPEKFQIQSPVVANPPTFFISVYQMIKEIKKEMNGIEIDKNTNQQHHTKIEIPSQIKDRIRDISRHLLRYLTYLETSQESSVIPNTFVWSQRTADHVLPSGFDDFPRGLQPIYEDKHVDLHSWILYSNKIMIELCKYLDEDSKPYEDKYEHFFRILYDEYFNKERALFSDYGMTVAPPPNSNNYEHGFVNHDGYVTILPLLLGLVPKNNNEVKNILELMRDPSKLWSSYGLRSLSADDPYYGKGENYWRGSIWININYLALQSLYNNYMSDDCVYKKLATSIYNELRSNIILLISKEFKRSGYIWEHYDAKTGYGMGTHPFTGWSSLILLIMSEIY